MNSVKYALESSYPDKGINSNLYLFLLKMAVLGIKISESRLELLEEMDLRAHRHRRHRWCEIT